MSAPAAWAPTPGAPWTPWTPVDEAPRAPSVALVQPRVVRTAGWTVTACSAPGATVTVERSGACLVVTVGDEGAPPSACTRVELGADGTALVHAAATPPAVLVSAEAARTLPELPGLPGRTTVAPDERLLVVSADALDALPESLAAVLRALPSRVSSSDPAQLLAELFADLPRGGGVIVTRGTASLPSPPDRQVDPEEETWAPAWRS